MTGNSLYDPLGQEPRRSSASRLQIFKAVVALGIVCLVGAGSSILWRNERTQPGPVAVVPIGPLPPVAPPPDPPKAATPPSTPPAAAGAAQTGESVEAQSGVTVFRPPGTTASAGAFIAVPQADAVALPAAPDGRVVEKGKYGALPRIGPGGIRPADVYARPASVDPSLPADAPRIAIFVGGMGLNRALTAAAARSLPPGVTFGFAPYGGDLDQQVRSTRDLGHETVLQVPMESFNVPDGMDMPRMLTTTDSAAETADNLHWQMSRFVGYAGLSNFLGGKFTADANAFRPVLKEIAERGLFYFDDGTAPRSLATPIGPSVGLPLVHADVVIDALGDPSVVDAGLSKLAAVARARGSAVGSTTGFPTAVDRIAAFAKGLSKQGIALVPVSAMAKNPSAP